MRTSQGVAADSTGGDFRFQGQWLESATGLYNFRARDYDSRTGTFLSRDPVDPNEQQPEALNPYQAMYNNPYVYSDPSGMFTLMELNAVNAQRSVLEYGRSILINGAREFIEQKVGEVVGGLMMNVISRLLPGNPVADAWATVQSGVSNGFEDFLRDNICNALRAAGKPFAERLWLEPAVSSWNGKPQSNGLNCAGEALGKPGPNAAIASKPDFIVKDGYPYRSPSGKGGFKYRNPKAYLIGDVKASATAALRDINSDDNQWQAISKYASKYQALPFALYVTFMRGFRGDTLTDSELASQTLKAQGKALSRGVVLYLLNIYD